MKTLPTDFLLYSAARQIALRRWPFMESRAAGF